MGSNFGDLDNDGWLDFYLGTGAPDYSVLVPNRMFKNVAGRRFAEITGVSPTEYRRRAAEQGGPAPIPGCFVLMCRTGLPAPREHVTS